MDRDFDALVALRVAAIMDGGPGGTYNLVLQEITGPRRIVMAIGLSEAQSIAVSMEGVTLPRPLTHDLMVNMLKRFGVSVSRVIIDELQGGFFTASIVCDRDGEPIVFDSRTSDAVTLALRCQAPIFVREHVISLINGGKGATSPRRPDGKLTLQDLPVSTIHKMFNEAIENEDYERAQTLQDELKRRGQAE